ncbi:MAG: response regulator [Candidatus Promineifilaceae bacterium]
MATILHIEDNPANQLLVERVLGARGHRLIQAYDGESGLRLAAETQPDLILVDMGLPDLDGQTVVTHLQQMPATRHLPMVAITAWPEEQAREIARRYGLSGCIVKPIDVATFPEQVAAFLPADAGAGE